MTELVEPPSYVPPELSRSITALCDEFAGVHAPETVAWLVVDSYRQLARHARIPSFLPLLAARFARERLQATARVEGIIVSHAPEVLFVCVHNAGRSQMAAGLLKRYAGDRVVVRSAGSAPVETINPAVVAVMAEFGVDLAQGFPSRSLPRPCKRRTS